MQRKHFLPPLIILAILLSALTASAIAEDDERFRHDIQYLIDGRITIDREVGHACTTGAVKRQQVRGYGEMTRTESVRIAPHIMRIDESSDWTTADDALRNLSVVTAIDLCARPITTADHDYDIGDYDIKEGDQISPYHPLVVSGDISVSNLTDQVWITSIESNPGEVGSFDTSYHVAYGPGPIEEIYGQLDSRGIRHFYVDDYRWWYDPDEDGGIDRGDYYVGNYFNIDQYAYTSGGEMSRYISMSSPFSGAVLVEDMNVVGMAEVRESFKLDNLEGGPLAVTLEWYDLF